MSDVNYKNIDEFIDSGIKDLASSTVKKSKIRTKSPINYFDKFKIKLKHKKLNTVLKPVSVHDKYRKFLGSTTSTDAYGPVNASGMDSGVGDVGISSGGWGAGDGWGVTAFGEGITQNSIKFIEFIRNIKNDYNIDVINVITDGYKLLYRNIESQSSAILLGIQPSLLEYMNFNIDAFVFSLNNFMGDIISVYIGSVNGCENIDDIKLWYKSIGVIDTVIANIIFIEKSSLDVYNTSNIDINFVTGDIDININNNNDIAHLVCNTPNPILIGCVDTYFMAEFMTQLVSNNIKFQVDKNYIFLG